MMCSRFFIRSRHGLKLSSQMSSLRQVMRQMLVYLGYFESWYNKEGLEVAHSKCMYLCMYRLKH